MKISIKARLTDAILFEADISDDTPERDRTKRALEVAVSARANLAGANLDGAYLAGAYLAGANLAGANLDGANLAGANLAGDLLPVSRDQAVANLDKVREIILSDQKRLNMGHWHGDEKWVDRSCAEETLCGTTHCLAGWLQVCSTNEKVRALEAPLHAGIIEAPIASHMFFRGDAEALKWLETREYAEAENQTNSSEAK